MRQVEQAVRNARFRRIVLQAYNSRRAICNLDLGNVEAAHIIPVAEAGTDEPANRIAFSVLSRFCLVCDWEYTAKYIPDLAVEST